MLKNISQGKTSQENMLFDMDDTKETNSYLIWYGYWYLIHKCSDISAAVTTDLYRLYCIEYDKVYDLDEDVLENRMRKDDACSQYLIRLLRRLLYALFGEYTGMEKDYRIPSDAQSALAELDFVSKTDDANVENQIIRFRQALWEGNYERDTFTADISDIIKIVRPSTMVRIFAIIAGRMNHIFDMTDTNRTDFPQLMRTLKDLLPYLEITMLVNVQVRLTEYNATTDFVLNKLMPKFVMEADGVSEEQMSSFKRYLHKLKERSTMDNCAWAVTPKTIGELSVPEAAPSMNDTIAIAACREMLSILIGNRDHKGKRLAL